MSRQVFKTVSFTPIEFIPEKHKNDPDLSVSAKEIEKRPLIFLVRKLTREDRLNLRGITKFEKREEAGETVVVPTNIGAFLRYIYEHAVVEVRNVLLEDEKLESVKGEKKNGLFDTQGIEEELLECVKFIQDISQFKEDEEKN